MRWLVLGLTLAGCGSSSDEKASNAGCGACEIANLEGKCVPNLEGCDYAGPYIGYYGDDPGVFAPVGGERGIYLDGGEFTIAPGAERTQCTYHVLDLGEDFVLGRYEARMKPGSHHFNMFRSDAARLAELGVELDTPRDCVAGGVPYYVAGSEWQYVDAPLPDGLGLKIPDGVALEMQAHYINTSDQPITGRVEVNLFRRDPAEIEHHVGLYFNIMQGFEVAPGSSATFSARCPAREGVKLVMLTSHMHRFGRRFAIDLFDDLKGTREPIYESLDYGHPRIVQKADDPLLIGPGQGFEWSCEFENSTGAPVREGEMGLTDEMCIMIAFYYDDDGALPYCFQTGNRVN
jgi:hypothetical protein